MQYVPFRHFLCVFLKAVFVFASSFLFSVFLFYDLLCPVPLQKMLLLVFLFVREQAGCKSCTPYYYYGIHNQELGAEVSLPSRSQNSSLSEGNSISGLRGPSPSSLSKSSIPRPKSSSSTMVHSSISSRGGPR